MKLKIPLEALSPHTQPSGAVAPVNCIVGISDFVTYINSNQHPQVAQAIRDAISRERQYRIDSELQTTPEVGMKWDLSTNIVVAELAEKSLDTDIDFEYGSHHWTGRAHICSCEQGRYWSVACRDVKAVTDDAPVVAPAKPAFEVPKGKGWYCEPPVAKANSDKGKSSGTELAPNPSAVQHLLDWYTLRELVYEELFFNGRDRAGGLLLFAGETSSGKSQLLQRVIHRCVCDRIKADSTGPRHLITLERPLLDPIDTVVDRNSVPTECLQRGLELTRRQQGIDFLDLGSALEDALRQKPILVHVDEVRRPDEWEAVMRFAATGHLITTTAHAPNVPIALGKLFREMGARIPAERGELGRSLLGVVHLRAENFADSKCVKRAVLPAVWRNTDVGISALVWPGLDSLVPAGANALSATGPNSKDPYLGRAYFAAKMKQRLKSTVLPDDLCLQAQLWDLTEI